MNNAKLLELAKPLIQYLENNYDPHCKIEVSANTVKVIRTEEQHMLEPQSYKFVPEDSTGKYPKSTCCACPI